MLATLCLALPESGSIAQWWAPWEAEAGGHPEALAKTGDVAQLVTCGPSVCQALGSIKLQHINQVFRACNSTLGGEGRGISTSEDGGHPWLESLGPTPEHLEVKSPIQP